jgi:hypothetical protein
LALISLGEQINDARARYAVLKGRLAAAPWPSRGDRGAESGRARHRTAAGAPSKRNRRRKPVVNSGVDLVRRGHRLLRKEVIQPHLPVRLPCYDFTPIADPTFGSSLLKEVGPLTSGVADFRGVTGGVYKARERIHPGVADPGLLATPASWSRVADSNPN